MAEKASGYRIEYATSNRAKCKGPKPCGGTPITKGDMRFGTVVDIGGHANFAWRHWGCVTKKLIENMKAKHDEASDLDGFEDLKDEDKAKIIKAWQDGEVADEDIPDSARKPAGEEGEEKPKKTTKKATKKKADEAEDDDAEEAPKKKAGTSKVSFSACSSSYVANS
ncbi:zf-PARP-domain-containing protein [Pholiota conissans]|uniref:Zf-PARP-domain-containing protein n=1 Tax=Pholiota conissans TaxID=109636 RepID=A0A9P5Z6F7_9AGAR|nr:zf-PARP-domain-containing protein [Pholiota conissans]